MLFITFGGVHEPAVLPIALSTEEWATPFMLDWRTAKDTLVLIFEEDFRFENNYDIVQGRKKLRGSVDGGSEAATTSLPPTSTISTAENQRRMKGRYYDIPTKASARAHEPDAMSNKLSDIVRLCTHASRNSCGKLMWLSWNPVGADGDAPEAARFRGANTFIVATVRAARVLWHAMSSDALPRGHFDDNLKKWQFASLPPGQALLDFGYLYPPMGHYFHHTDSVDSFHEKPDGRSNC